MERRALLAAVLCLIVLLGYQEGVRYLYPPPPETEAPLASPQPTRADPAAAPNEPEPREAEVEEAQPTGADAQIPVETDLFAAQVSTRGGRLVSFRLKHFRTSVDDTSAPLEVVEVAPTAAKPLGLRITAASGKSEDDTAVSYSASAPGLVVTGADQAHLVLTGTLPSGGRIEKTLVFTGDAYPFKLRVGVQDDRGAVASIGVGWRQHVGALHTDDSQAAYRGASVLAANKVVHEYLAGLEPGQTKTFDPPVGWAGYADHYFLAALVPPDPGKARSVVSAENGGVQILLSSAVDDGSTESATQFNVYVGPKDVEILEASGDQLARAVDFGWFAFLAVPLLRLLKLFHTVTHNYGVDIILLTILVKVLFIPLSNKSMKSMRDMQRLQPQMAKLREKFKDDRERLNKEMIELYRRHRVNPLGGCLPMLLQFPVFIGLYQALNNAIELRHAGFALWIRDLSTYECYPWPGLTMEVGCNDFSVLGISIPILVILMGASMILQQWLTPATGMDPTQQRMMMVLMPVMFTVMFVTFPSGLVLYWLVNNVLTIAQQWWTNRSTA